jgi:hypothetical protein
MSDGKPCSVFPGLATLSFESHDSRYAISVVSSVAYGRRVKDMNDRMVKENQEIDRCECIHSSS